MLYKLFDSSAETVRDISAVPTPGATDRNRIPAESYSSSSSGCRRPFKTTIAGARIIVTQVRDMVSACIVISFYKRCPKEFFHKTGGPVTNSVTNYLPNGLLQGIPIWPSLRHIRGISLQPIGYFCSKVYMSGTINIFHKAHPLHPRIANSQTLISLSFSTQQKGPPGNGATLFYGRQFQRRQSHQNSLVQE